MDAVVHGDEVEARRRARRVRVPAVEQDGRVVVPVQEDEGLLAQHDKGRVHELGQLGRDEKHRPQARCAVAVPRLRRVAHGRVEAAPRDEVDEERGRAQEAHCRKGGQCEVPHGEGALEAQGADVRRLHDLDARVAEGLPGEGTRHVSCIALLCTRPILAISPNKLQ